uniref:SJCHGC07175 protein n=1 Tax=Schistosoma japonicum TaxID=6182 RepID=Q5DAR1_SCHJA|nr:SJCHGC07175 protein [Schistosoma japonicum]
MSLMEIVRSISSIIKRTVDPTMLFDKGEYMDEVLWQLLCVLYDIPITNFKKVDYLKLLMLTATNLGFAGNFTMSNFFRDKKDRRKWIPFLSCLVSWFEYTDTGTLQLTRQEKGNTIMQSS